MAAGFLSFCRSLLATRWIRFGLVGGVATVAYFLLGLLFVNLLQWSPLVGNAAAYVLSFVVSYLGQSLWTFEGGSGKHAKMLPKFAATQAFGLALNTCIVELCLRCGIKFEFAMLVAIVLVPVAVYLICKYWVFSKKEGA